MSLLLAVFGAIPQGFMWGIMALGVFITFRLLNFADMTCDGSFALGGCISASLVVGLGINSYTSLIIAALAGMIAGTVTGLLHTKLKIPAILAGILTMISLYSINIRIMGKPNMPMLGVKTIVTHIKDLLHGVPMKDSLLQTCVALLIGVLACILIISALYWFFGTEMGSAIRATGNNEDMIRALGQNTDTTKILGLAISNGLIALSGALVSQSQSYADVSMGQGAIVIGLASIVIGEVFMGKRANFAKKLSFIVGGSIIYRIIIALVLQMGLDTNDLKLLTALMVAAALSVPILVGNRQKPKQAGGAQ